MPHVVVREPQGRARPRPLLFVHGDCTGAWFWSNFLEFLTRRQWRCLALDLTGHGENPRPPAGEIARLDVATYVEDVRRFADGLDPAPVLVGHSSGALVAAKYLERHGGTAGVLLAPAPPGGVPSCWTLGRALEFLPLVPSVFWQMITKGYVGVTARGARRLWFRNLSLTEVAAFAERYDFTSRRSSLEIALGRVAVDPARLTMPLLVVGARHDRVVVPQTAQATAEFYGATYVEMPDLAHDVVNDRGWEESAAVVANWLDSRFGPSPGL